jgi:spermidine synthase
MPSPAGVRAARARRAAVLAAFFASGAAGLVYEVVWIRRAALAFGSTTYALSTVLAVFFLGLALGSELFGRLSSRLRRPLAAYAGLELALALLGLLSLPAFALAETLQGALYRASGGAGAATELARAGLVALVLLAPTLLMGGTLPLVCRHFVRERGRIAAPVALLYALNTLGAAAGCLAAGFLLLPGLGMRGSIAAAAGLNLLSALLVAATRPARAVAPAPPTRRESAPWDGPRAAVAGLFLVSGFAAVGQEVVWTRFLSLVIRNDTHTYTLTLAAVLLGIVLGSWLSARLFDRARSRARWFAWLQIGFALSVLAAIGLPPAAWRALGGSLEVIFALLLPPAILSGAAFPLAVRMVADDPAWVGFSVGRMGAANMLGGIAGSLAVGFAALPHLGLAHAVRLTTGASLLAGAAAWLFLVRDARPASRAAAVLASLALWAALPLVSGTRLPADWLAGDGQLVDYREGLEAHVAVIRSGGALQLEIDRRWQGSDRKSHQIVAAHVPALLHPRPLRVLVVGVGAGQTAERFLLHDVAALDCVDIEPAVFDLIRPYFGGAWLDDPRVRPIRADGRSLLAYDAETWDIVSLELGQLSRPGVASFYTLDFYRRARERLAPGGLLANFVPVPFLSLAAVRSVVRTFREVFPESVLWYNRSELLLIGARDRLALEPERLARLGSDPRLREDLRYSQWGGPAMWLNQPHAFLGGLLAGGQELAAFAAEGRILRDDRPWLEYAAAKMSSERASERDLDFLAAIRPHLSPIPEALGLEVDAATAEGAARVRERNLGDIAAGAELRRYRALRRAWPPERLLPIVERALAANPESLEVRLAAAELLARLGSLERAEAELRALLALAPDDPRGRTRLAALRERQRELRRAERPARRRAPRRRRLHDPRRLAHAPGGPRRIDRGRQARRSRAAPLPARLRWPRFGACRRPSCARTPSRRSPRPSCRASARRPATSRRRDARGSRPSSNGCGRSSGRRSRRRWPRPPRSATAPRTPSTSTASGACARSTAASAI